MQLDELLRHKQRRVFVRALDILPKSPEAVYDTIVARINNQASEDAILAYRTFSWIFYAREPISFGQLQYATAIQYGEKNIDPANGVEEDVLIAICEGLIIIDKRAQTVRFVHPTARAYFESRLEPARISEASVAMSCLTFLLSDNLAAFIAFEDGMAQVPFTAALSPGDLHVQSIDRTSDELSFFYYASRYVLIHSIAAELDDEVFALLTTVFRDASLFSRLLRLRHRRCDVTGINAVSHLHVQETLCIAASFGSTRLTEYLIRGDSSVNTRDSDGWTPLFAAAAGNSICAVKMLLERGADPAHSSFKRRHFHISGMQTDPYCHLPIHCAIIHGNVKMAQLLEQYGALLGTPKPTSQSIVHSLRLAILSRSRAMVQFVLDHGTEGINERDPFGQPPLHAAISASASEIVSMLLERGASVTEKNKEGRTPMELAICASSIGAAPDSEDASMQMCKVLSQYTPAGAEIVTSSFFYFNLLWMVRFRPKTLMQLKVHSWSNALNSENGLFEELWSELLDGSQNSACEAVQRDSKHDFTAEDFAESHILTFAAFRGWTILLKRLLEVAGGLNCNPSVANEALC